MAVDRDPIPQRARASIQATAALVLGLVGLVCFVGILVGPSAILQGVLGLHEISRSGGRLVGKGRAIAGILLGVLGLCLPLVLVYEVLWGREADRIQSRDSLAIMAMAMDHYHEHHGQLPEGAALRDGQGRLLLSWRVALLPYIDNYAEDFYRQFRLDEPWDSPHNRALIGRTPPIYALPGADPQVVEQGMTYYRAITGPRSAFARRNGRPPSLLNIPDGPSNTIMIVEAADAVIWTKPDELEYVPGGPLPRLGRHFRGGPQVVLCDGSVRQLSRNLGPATVEAALTADGGEVLRNDW